MRTATVAATALALALVACDGTSPGGVGDAADATTDPAPATTAATAPSPSPSPSGEPSPTPPPATGSLSFVERTGEPPETTTTLVVVDLGTDRRSEYPLQLQDGYDWAPDGDRLAYLPPAGHGPSARSVRVAHLDAADGEPDTLALDPSPGSDALEVTWSPDGDLVAVVRRPVDDSTVEVVVVGGDGRDARRLVEPAPDTEVFFLDWSPDGRRLAYRRIDRAAAAAGEPDPTADGIHVVGRDGAPPQPVVEDLYDETRPAWSPDGDWIAFLARSAPDPAPFRLYVVRPDGRDRRQVVDDDVQGRIAWAPDGRRAAVAGGRVQEPGDVLVIDLGAGDTTATLHGRDNDREPVWSPDGTRIAFLGFAGPEGVSDVYLATPDGTEVERLTDTGRSFAPAFRPRP